MQKNFRHELEVRDYELDAQGVVNNAVYVSYLEVGRHKYCAANGLDLLSVEARGYRFMLAALSIRYRQSLRSGMKFYVTAVPRYHGKLKLVFEQGIYLVDDDTCIATAEATVICYDISRQRPCSPAPLIDCLGINQ